METTPVAGTVGRGHGEPPKHLIEKGVSTLTACSEKLPDREPHPCENRNDRPGIKAGVAGPQCRTSKQVVADCEAERIAMLAEVKRGEDARHCLAELQLQEEHETHHQSE